MTPRDWLLILCAYRGAPVGLDPVRVQKGMFLFARSGAVPPDERYDFRPYDYGPMSAAIYSDLDALVADGLLEPHEVPGKSWSRYTVTERGRSAAAGRLTRLTRDSDKKNARRLYEIKREVASLSFNQLLDRVYRDHPDMATHSVFRPPS
ncbi:MAG: hypothetical protein ABSG43_22140 [Solirubrobacteraceae bacterium]|jgi:uncharacterized protein YwgA